MKRTILALVFSSIAPAALGQALPRLDIQQYCARQAPSPGLPPEMAQSLCVDDETASLTVLKESWKTYSAASKTRCLQATGGRTQYSDLQACILAAESRQATEGW
jgi:hypothetical protein